LGGVIVIVGDGFILTVTVANPMQPGLLPATSYVVLTVVFVITDDPVVVFNPEAGDQ
jgi:hypothetical protein